MEENDFPKKLRDKHGNDHKGHITACKDCKQKLEWLLNSEGIIFDAIKVISTEPYKPHHIVN